LPHIDLPQGWNRTRTRRRADRDAIDRAARRILYDRRRQVVILIALQVNRIDVVELSAHTPRSAHLHFTAETGLIGSRILVVRRDSCRTGASEGIRSRTEAERCRLLYSIKWDDRQLVQ